MCTSLASSTTCALYVFRGCILRGHSATNPRHPQLLKLPGDGPETLVQYTLTASDYTAQYS
jgi:hypothetical protein